MSDFIDRWLDTAIREAESDSLRFEILEELEAATSGGVIDETGLKRRLLQKTEPPTPEEEDE